MQKHPMWIVGAIIIAGMALYLAFMGINDLGLSETTGRASVLSKEYKPASTTYRPQRVGDRMQNVPVAVPEAHILKLSIGGSEAEFPVEKSLYEGLEQGDQVTVTYVQKRITGTLTIIRVER